MSFCGGILKIVLFVCSTFYLCAFSLNKTSPLSKGCKNLNLPYRLMHATKPTTIVGHFVFSFHAYLESSVSFEWRGDHELMDFLWLAYLALNVTAAIPIYFFVSPTSVVVILWLAYLYMCDCVQTSFLGLFNFRFNLVFIFNY
jgi:hypothetical protein